MFSDFPPAVKELYIIRHGQTEMNRLGLVQGSGVDSDLNDTGREQARRFFLKYASAGFDKVYTSALKRTHQSVEKFVQLGLPTEALADLNEISWGNKEGKPITPEENELYYATLRAWGEGQTHIPFAGGESPDEVAKRLQRAVAHILSRPEEDKVLLCMHGRAMRVLLCLLLGYPTRCMEGFPHQNLCLYKAVWTGSRFHLQVCNEAV
jgi:probable phosphoglycerate mutase